MTTTVVQVEDLSGKALIAVKDQVRAAIEENPYADRILLDLTQIKRCDANGTDLLVGLYTDPFFAGKCMELGVVCRPELYRKLNRLGLPSVFGSEQEAGLSR